eukprot:CAMPEP_0177172020 /NCGR_PEP_ID=MMETSP0367-20130122/10913_1 /TAXON_ID=447022 ORGANISM="Scrippsiella hangoei-like, Strain SHHI-4" /NCGR_SAMPLE_ID=MMETSP0367 /ASSEMBLY_ACC=CAM_ASM_000362 /LENGTH=79 /DNA_ID=CAMNT_0018618265 /DNA_START=318 /DNA_END=556 /DNA_ORIENTATION=-
MTSAVATVMSCHGGLGRATSGVRGESAAACRSTWRRAEPERDRVPDGGEVANIDHRHRAANAECRTVRDAGSAKATVSR